MASQMGPPALVPEEGDGVGGQTRSGRENGGRFKLSPDSQFHQSQAALSQPTMPSDAVRAQNASWSVSAITRPVDM